MTKRGSGSLRLSERYPDIDFYLRFTPWKKRKLPKTGAKLEKWLKGQNLEEIDILYLVGLLECPLPDPIETWLKDKPERALVWIETDLGAIAQFQAHPSLANPQVHLCYAQTDPMEQLAEDFPSERIAIFEGKPFEGERLKRRSAAYSALYSDVLYSHKIVENVLVNFTRLAHCFDGMGEFYGLPLIVCGAGPSLEKAIPLLKAHPNKAVILAVGSAITALTNQGITPHLAMALDPNTEEFERLSRGQYFEGPFLFSPRLHQKVFATANGPFGYLPSDTGGLIEHFLDQKCHLQNKKRGPDLGSEAFSVTTLALSWASVQGFSKIIFAGLDLAYTNGRRYSEGIEGASDGKNPAHTLEQVIFRKDIHGKKVETLLKWVMEAQTLSSFAKSHPELDILNGSEGGLGLEGIPQVDLNKLLSGLRDRDIKAQVHQFVQTQSLSFDEENFFSILDLLCNSLERAAFLCAQILEAKGGKRALYVTDFQTEPAYEALLEGIDKTLDRLLLRHYPALHPKLLEQKREEAKYKELKRQIEKFQEICEKLQIPRTLELR